MWLRQVGRGESLVCSVRRWLQAEGCMGKSLEFPSTLEEASCGQNLNEGTKFF